MTGPRPDTAGDEVPTVGLIGPEPRLLQVGYRLQHEPGGPQCRSRQPPPRQGLLGSAGHGGEGCCQGQGDPQPLEGPGHEQLRRIGQDPLEAGVGPRLAYSAEEEGAQAGGPDRHEPGQQERPRVVATHHHDREQHDGQVAEGAGEVVVPLGAGEPGRHEHHPVDGERHRGRPEDHGHSATAHTTRSTRERHDDGHGHRRNRPENCLGRPLHGDQSCQLPAARVGQDRERTPRVQCRGRRQW